MIFCKVLYFGHKKKQEKCQIRSMGIPRLLFPFMSWILVWLWHGSDHSLCLYIADCTLIHLFNDQIHYLPMIYFPSLIILSCILLMSRFNWEYNHVIISHNILVVKKKNDNQYNMLCITITYISEHTSLDMKPLYSECVYLL